MARGSPKMWCIIAVSFLMIVVNSSQENSEFRLPTNFKPISYQLDVTTHLDDKFTFDGVVDIKVCNYNRNLE